jgi:hypothetical protein
MAADLVLMTGNVAQVFVTDDAWHANLQSSYDALGASGQAAAPGLSFLR